MYIIGQRCCGYPSVAGDRKGKPQTPIRLGANTVLCDVTKSQCSCC